MEVNKIPYNSINQFSNFVHDFVSKTGVIHNFFEYEPVSEDIWKAIANRTEHPIDRNLLTSVISKQYAEGGVDLPDSVNTLKNPNSFTITTGHQLCLAGGPMFVAYKIAGIINLCSRLTLKYSEYNFVPVFWMASEDHDFEEINHIHLFGHKFEWNTSELGAVGAMSTANVSKVIDEIGERVNKEQFGPAIAAALKLAYKKGNLADATRSFVHFLFPNTNLVIIDANDRSLKGGAAEIWTCEFESKFSQQKVLQQSVELAKNYKPQVSPREINLFYLDDQIRNRFIFNEGKYEVLDTELKFTLPQITELIKSQPEKISPNVILRPIYQESILPNIAYLGGGGELAYWAQLKSAFKSVNVFFPVVFLRNSFLHISQSNQKKISKLFDQLIESQESIDENLFKSKEELIKRYLSLNSENLIDTEIQAVEHEYTNLVERIENISKELSQSAQSEFAKVRKGLQSLEKKMRKFEKKKHEQTLMQLNNLKERLFPDGKLQERKLSIVEMYAQYGPKFMQRLVDISNPFDLNFTILRDSQTL